MPSSLSRVLSNTDAKNMSHYAMQLSHAGELGECEESQSVVSGDVLLTQKFLMYRWTVRAPPPPSPHFSFSHWRPRRAPRPFLRRSF